ncbi:MAG: helix-turn-helix transcriptional regulator [Clostridia bacterium]|nr:helix-turn-helix transcriptional regulator [Clostridia bacterium]
MEDKKVAKECGLRLRRVRMTKNMSQQALADKMYTTPQNVSKWENQGISDVDTIKELSRILGQDILSDERNEEGVVGEIGKHILKQVAQNNGFIPVEELINSHMYGLSAEIVTDEIFKLERIGMCVREQYKNFYDIEKDMVFITAKGLITLNNFSVFGNIVSKTYEMFLEGRNTIQEYYDENKVERIIRNLRYCGTYRIDYINYLHKRYEKVYIDEHEDDGCDYDDWKAKFPMLPGKGFRVDLLFRMISGLSDRDLSWNAGDLLYYNSNDPCPTYTEMYEWDYGEDDIPYIDKVLSEKSEIVQKWNEKINSQMNIERKNLSNADDTADIAIDNMNFQLENADYFIERKNAFVEGKYPSEWFSLDEIKAFIKENFRSAETVEENEIDSILEEINKLAPDSLDYYDCATIAIDDSYSKWFFLDNKWREAGIEDLIKSYYNLPDTYGCIDEQEGDE